MGSIVSERETWNEGVFILTNSAHGVRSCKTCFLMRRSSRNVSPLAEDPADLLSATGLIRAVPEKAHFSDLTLTIRFPSRELQREKVWSRIHIVPLLLAEGDRDAYRRQEAMLERERVVMRDVKDWEVGFFSPKRCISSRELMWHLRFCVLIALMTWLSVFSWERAYTMAHDTGRWNPLWFYDW